MESESSCDETEIGKKNEDTPNPVLARSAVSTSDVANSGGMSTPHAPSSQKISKRSLLSQATTPASASTPGASASDGKQY